MKNLLKTLLVALLVFMGFTYKAKAISYTEEYVIDRVEKSEVKAQVLLNDLTIWSNSYSNTTKSILTKNFLNKLDYQNYEKNMDLIIEELSNKGYNQASNDLLNKKQNILDNIKYLKETLNILEIYLEENVENGVLGSTDLFIQLRNSLKNLKQPSVDLFNIYYDLYYDDVNNKINEYDSVSELIDLYEKTLDKLSDFDFIISKVKNKADKWQDLYNKYNMQDYEDLFINEFGDYYTKLESSLRKLYTKLENKLQQKLDNRITTIVNNTDLTDVNSIINRNEKLFDLINSIEDVKTEVQDKFSNASSNIKIDRISKLMNKYQTKVINRIDEAIKYTKNYLLDVIDIEVKEESDKSFISINKNSGLIVYDLDKLSTTEFINKLFTSYGNFSISNTYKNNIGTLSILKITYNNVLLKEFKLIVKGDINPSGRIDISDVVKLCNKMFGKENLDMYQMIAADMNDDSKIDITDVVKLCNKLFK